MRFMKGSASECRSAESGSVVVEFALISTLFLFLVGLIVQGAFIFSAWLIITNAVREGARFGAPCYQRDVSQCDELTIDQRVRIAAQGVDVDALDVSVTSSGGYLVITAGYSVPIIAPFVEQIMPGGTITVSAESAMRYENNS